MQRPSLRDVVAIAAYERNRPMTRKCGPVPKVGTAKNGVSPRTCLHESGVPEK